VRVLCLGVALFGSGSCGELGQSCTEIGCSDQAALTLRPAGGEWIAGSYELSVTVDGVERRCAFSVPADLPEPRSGRALCDPLLPFYIQPETVCTERRDRDSVSQTCTPIPDRYSGSLTLQGTPAVLVVIVERDGQILSNETLKPAYQASRPNGPGCEPLCRQARAELEF
jgi:hypothetical protein